MSATSPFEHRHPTKPLLLPTATEVSVPLPLTPLVGREREVADIAALLDTDTTRLVTLTGPGGVGKTRLSLEVARSLEGEFAHGVCVVLLASVWDAAQVPYAVARALGIQESGDRSAEELVASVLRERHLLLVLDNLEHIVDGASPWVSETLSRSPRVTALVTSRVALRVAGEQRFVVEPLALPDPADAGDVGRLSRSAAVQLFVRHARGVAADFDLDAGNAEEIHAICRALDGLPLAIELAASRVTVLSPQQLRARLCDSLGLLRSDRRDAPARHQTMRDAIAWSYDLLSPDQQRLFRHLSTFQGGFTMGAAEAIGADLPDEPIIDRISGLIDHSLVRKVPAGSGGMRFVILEVLREFGLDRLRVHGELEAARDAHASWYAAMAAEAELALEGAGQVEWLNLLDVEHDNIRSALTWLADQERVQEAMDLAGSLLFFLWNRGHDTEARQRYQTLLGHPLAAEPTVARGKALNALGLLEFSRGDLTAALAAQQEAIAIFRERHATGYLVRVLSYIGCTLRMSGRLDEVETACTESRELARSTGDAWGMAVPLVDLGLTSAQRGDMAAAWSRMHEGAELCRASGDRWGLSICLGNMGAFAMAEGDASAAERYWRESTALIHELGGRRDLPYALSTLADVSWYHGDLESAGRYLRQALVIARETGEPYQVAWSLMRLGQLATLARDLDRSVGLLRESVASFPRLQNVGDLALCMEAFADVAIATAEMTVAARFVGAADAMLDRGGQARQDILPGEHQARLDAITAALGPEAYRQAWSGGAALTQEEALAEAMSFEPAGAEPALASDTPSPAAMAGLSPRELEVLRLLADGLTNRDIADSLFVSARTVENHVFHICGKLDVSSRTGAVAHAIRNGLA